jgi:hypothetical protein
MATSPATKTQIHAFAAFLDDRMDIFDVQSSLGRLYIRVLLTGQLFSLQPGFDVLDYGVKELACRLHYVRDISGMKETDYVEVPVSKLRQPRIHANWYQSSFADPYEAFCTLPSAFAKTNTSVLPVAVTILPTNKSHIEAAGHTVIIGGKENLKIKHRIFDHRGLLEGSAPALGTPGSVGSETSSSSSTGIPPTSNTLTAAVAPTATATITEILRADSTSRIHDGFHSLQMQHSHQHRHRREEAEFAVCVNPITGSDALSNDYNDPARLMTFINYYSSLGAAHIFMFNTMETYTSGTGTGTGRAQLYSDIRDMLYSQTMYIIDYRAVRPPDTSLRP